MPWSGAYASSRAARHVDLSRRTAVTAHCMERSRKKILNSRSEPIGFVLSDEQRLKCHSSPSCASSEQRVRIDRGFSIA